jgi:hypothetical protein
MANSSALTFKVVAEKNLAMRKPDGIGADVLSSQRAGQISVLTMCTPIC